MKRILFLTLILAATPIFYAAEEPRGLKRKAEEAQLEESQRPRKIQLLPNTKIIFTQYPGLKLINNPHLFAKILNQTNTETVLNFIFNEDPDIRNAIENLISSWVPFSIKLEGNTEYLNQIITHLATLNPGQNFKLEIQVRDNQQNVNQFLQNLANQLPNNISTLNLSGNGLRTIPESIGNLTQLTILRLDDNQLTTIPDSIGNLTQLEYLNLFDNPLSDENAIPGSMANLQRLDTLQLGSSGLAYLPTPITNLTNLTYLGLSNNLLVGLENIEQLTNLQELDLSDCLLDPQSRLDEAYYPNLNQCINQLDTIIHQIAELNNLKSLDLSNNKLIYLPDVIGNLKNLRKLNLQGNNFSQETQNEIQGWLPTTRIKF